MSKPDDILNEMRAVLDAAQSGSLVDRYAARMVLSDCGQRISYLTRRLDSGEVKGKQAEQANQWLTRLHEVAAQAAPLARA